MSRRDILRRRIQKCRAILVLQMVIQFSFAVVVWNAPDAHRHFFNLLWYGSLFIQAGLALIPGRRISEAREELNTVSFSGD